MKNKGIEIMRASDLKNDYKYEKSKRRDFSLIRSLYDMKEEEEYSLDDQSYNDLDMSSVYEKIDRTYSSVGEAALYCMLRNIHINNDVLKKRSKLIDLFRDDIDLRAKVHVHYFNLGYDNKNSLLDMIKDYLVINKKKYYIYTFLGTILPLILGILTIVMANPKFLIALFGVVLMNSYINNKEAKEIKDVGLVYLRRIIVAAKKVSKINLEELNEYKVKIESILNQIKVIDKGTRVIGFGKAFAGIFEGISVMFLLEEAAYYRISSEIEEKRSLILELYCILGEIEALISVACYQGSLDGNFSKPEFIKEVQLEIEEGIHPLVEDAVSNSININTKGIVLTGTNMSGKSTFLRMLGINIVFAQCFNFVLAKKYKSCIFNIVSSISPSDDVNEGKSYYLAEAESILRIINATEKEIPVFCPIDEIFRGTNPTERIAASAEILKYINTKKTISIVATHDRELADILKENYEFFYFSESVDNKEGLSFDYKIKSGVSKTKNAIRLLEYIGYPKSIVKNAYKRSEDLEKFI